MLSVINVANLADIDTAYICIVNYNAAIEGEDVTYAEEGGRVELQSDSGDYLEVLADSRDDGPVYLVCSVKNTDGNYALKNDNILNIAVFGGYGSGKTSFLKTYFNKHSEYKKIYISLGSYNEGNKDNNGNIPERNINEYHQLIEKSILQQLLYQIQV